MNYKQEKFFINFIPCKKWRKILRENILIPEEIKKLKEIQLLIHSYVIESKKKEHEFYMFWEYQFWDTLLYWIWQRKEELHANIKVLDIGSSYGTLCVFFKKYFNADVYSIDFLEDIHSQKLYEEMGIHFHKCNIEREDLYTFNQKFDVIIFTECLEHLNFNPIQTLIKIKNALNDNGIVYFSTPDSDYYGIQKKYYNSFSEIPFLTEKNINADVIDDHIWQYNISELLNIFKDSGFKVSKIGHSKNSKHFNIIWRK